MRRSSDRLFAGIAIGATIITASQIWSEVFAGRVQQALDSTRARRAVPRPPSITGKRDDAPSALFVDPSLTSDNGHQSNLAVSYESLLGNLGYRTVVALAQAHSLKVRDGWWPYFLVPHATTAFRPIQTEAELGAVERYFEGEFAELIERCAPSVCVFATIRFTNIAAAAQVVARLRPSGACKVIFVSYEADEVPDCPDPAIVRSAYRRAATILNEAAIPSMIIAEAEYGRRFLVDCGFRAESVRLYPYVSASRMIRQGRSRDQKDLVEIGYVGGNRTVRKPELVADLLLSQSFPASIRWSVQLDTAYLKKRRGPDSVAQLKRMHREGAIALHPTGLSDDEYRALFGRLDFVLLPYSDRYQQIGSGVLLEAIYAGVTPILPQGSALTMFYGSLGGRPPTFGCFTVAALRDTILSAATCASDFRRAAETVREAWQRHPSSAERWRSDLAGWLADD